MTPGTEVQPLVPAGTYCRLNPAAAPCVPSIAGAVQLTIRLVPVPWDSVIAPGVFGAECVVAEAAT